MLLNELSTYADSLGENLTKIESKAEDDTMGHLVVTETKETYSFEDEQDADDKINDARQNPLFTAATKKN